MGFSLYLYKIDGDRLVDPDRDGVQEFLRRRRMHMKVFPPSSADRSSCATLLNEARIIQLEETLENAQIGEAADDGSVSAGTIVTAKVAGKEQAFALGGQEITADVPDGVKVFSPDAPLGQALMGHRAGDTVSYEAPTGRKIKAEIVKVERV